MSIGKVEGLKSGKVSLHFFVNRQRKRNKCRHQKTENESLFVPSANRLSRRSFGKRSHLQCFHAMMFMTVQ
jgi:hypothetical protein